ncbi:MAG: ATP-grasp domain-containing protein [Lachnospiraceae bacterium]|nr:ATP-grasp domain-containing protein [Lachnospiraceae bacterium]
MEVKTILFPSSFFSGKKVDEDLQNEYDAVLSTGLWDTVFFDYNKWFHEGKLVLSKKPESWVYALHRGWMMKAEQYQIFYQALQLQGIRLVTKPDEYEFFHYFPNVYQRVEGDTPRIITVPLGSPYSIQEIQKKFERFMVKDYVKSVKGTDFPKFFTSKTTDEEFQKAMGLFYQYRGELISGGLCFKEYVDLKTYGDKTNEYRVFYVNGEAATITRNSLQPDFTSEPPTELIHKYKNLPSPFYTLDYAELADGSWKILEAGDGSVSGPSEGQNLEAFYMALFHCLN